MKKNRAKLRVGVVMGGKSGEHEVSLISAASVINALNRDKYEVVPIGITKNGQWISGPMTFKILNEGSSQPLLKKILLPDPNQQSLVTISQRGFISDRRLNVIIPVLHGTYGEDGKIQGLFELANIPYVGSGVLGSALGMDKIVMKNLFRQAGLNTPDFLYFTKKEWQKSKNSIIRQIEKELKYPVFIKPANLGSSVGISKAKTRSQLLRAVILAKDYDRRIIVEKAVQNCREIECAVLGNDWPKASALGEVIPKQEFYSYEAKYIDTGGTVLKIPAKLDKNIVVKIQNMAVKAFKILDLAGMARVDFLIGGGKKIYLNEVNTIPGFTSISMYPKLWEISGIGYSELLDKLIKLAIERHLEKNQLKTSFNLKPQV